MAFTDRLREEVEKRRETKYRICKDAGLDFATLKRFLAGNAVSSVTIDKLVEYLGIEIRRARSRSRSR